MKDLSLKHLPLAFAVLVCLGMAVAFLFETHVATLADKLLVAGFAVAAVMLTVPLRAKQAGDEMLALWRGRNGGGCAPPKAPPGAPS